MNKNVTLRMDDKILKKCRHMAVEDNMSLSQWISIKISEYILKEDALQNAKNRALKRLKKNAIHLGGKPISREEIHGRS